MKYYVDIPVTVYITEVVEASSHDEAREMIRDLMVNGNDEWQERFRERINEVDVTTHDVSSDLVVIPAIVLPDYMGKPDEITLTADDIKRYCE